MIIRIGNRILIDFWFGEYKELSGILASLLQKLKEKICNYLIQNGICFRLLWRHRISKFEH